MPQYGDLEMVYQGRSAALAPIFLLRRDFSVEGDPEVLAQDPDLNVQRFAWSADGTAGAFLYADLLMGIDPGVDVHALTDGISAITFGDDATTVYAVRVTADGGNDVASIVAVDRITDAEQELDRVSYPRPVVGEEAALAEAQFSDDGGSVRLYWMHDDTLRLWILGAGTWTIDPAEGNATKAEEDALAGAVGAGGRAAHRARHGRQRDGDPHGRPLGRQARVGTGPRPCQPRALVAPRRPDRVHARPIDVRRRRPSGPLHVEPRRGRGSGTDADHEHRGRLRRRVARQPESRWEED